MTDHSCFFPLLSTSRERALAPDASQTHLGYSDESSWNQSRYRSLALVTGSAEAMRDLDSMVSAVLRESNVRELAWKNVASAKHRFAAIKVYDAVCNTMHNRPLRVDVLIWDTHDSRHRVRRRDDSENLARMYYHLMSNVISLRWNAVGTWLMRADERTDTDWETLEDCLRGRTRREKTAAQRQFGELVPLRTAVPPKVEQVSSSNHPLIQVADAFTGLAAFSWNQSAGHRTWKEVAHPAQSGQQNMFSSLGLGDISKSAQFKHDALDHVVGLNLVGVVMKTREGQGLRTFGPTNRINFWMYEPRRLEDTAPRKSRA